MDHNDVMFNVVIITDIVNNHYLLLLLTNSAERLSYSRHQTTSNCINLLSLCGRPNRPQ